MSILLLSLLTAIVAAAISWAVNQLPPLKAHVSSQVRIGMVIVLAVVAGLTAAGISAAGMQASAGGPGTAQAPVTPTNSPAESLPASQSAVPDPSSSESSSALSEDGVTESEPTPKGPTGPRSMFVADFEDSDVSSSSNSYQVGSVDLDGNPYSRSSLPTCYYSNTSTEFTLHRKWTQFTALAGIKDQAQSDYSATVTIYLDGDLWKRPLTVKVGSPESIKIDVTGVLKLKLICSPGSGHEGFIRLALGDALVSTTA